jgi:hypothetical protein
MTLLTPQNPVLWTGMKGASAGSRKNESDAETSLIFISPRFSMTWRFGSGLFVIPNQVLNLIQDLSISRSRFWVLEFRF